MTKHVHIAGTAFSDVLEIVATGWDGRILRMTRDAYFRLRKRPEGLPVSTAATYILYGNYFDRADEERRKLYVGKTTDAAQRGDAHEREKTFWTDALVFTSGGPWMNSAHAGAVETQFIKWASEANRYIVTNGTLGGVEPLGPYDEAMLSLFLRDVRAVLQMAGVDVFEPDPFGLFYFNTEETYGLPAFKARGRWEGDAIVVLAGSTLPPPRPDEPGFDFLDNLERSGFIRRSNSLIEIVADTRLPVVGVSNRILGTHAIRWLSANRQKLSALIREQTSPDNGGVASAADSAGTPP